MKMSWRQELDALGEELELEEQEELDKQLDVGPAVGLPEVPTAEPAKPASVPARARKERRRIQTWLSWPPGLTSLVILLARAGCTMLVKPLSSLRNCD